MPCFAPTPSPDDGAVDDMAVRPVEDLADRAGDPPPGRLRVPARARAGHRGRGLMHARTDENRGELRFEFGRNWERFLAHLDEARIADAEASLRDMLGLARLDGKRFLDVGSGSGLFSLAARRLGARVHSFDLDPRSVGCTRELRRRYFPDDDGWTVEQASALDESYLRALGRFDVVYSWGVLHHTGSMWRALGNAALPVAPGGLLYVAIYNDQGWISHYWAGVKRLYNAQRWSRAPLIALHGPYLVGARMVVRAVRRRGRIDRGMSLLHDMIDWLGGYPFEVARPDELERFFAVRGFVPIRVKTCGSRHGCNEFVLRSNTQPPG
jgi:2-polyprenyl-6-hydroxyphenyl methylase/3-demethylubiquinone-9 3-methyltransferase